MWLLSCSGELLGNKRLWLRPGTTHLLGRTSGRPEHGGRVQFIEHKSVSRKHLLIAVAPSTVHDASSPRTEVTLTDGSKVGTTVDGEKLLNSSRTVGQKDKYELRLGYYEDSFTLEWKEIVFTCQGLKKKSGKPMQTLDGLRNALVKDAGLDAAVVTEFVTNKTTHVVGNKRNTAIALTGLVQGCWIVGHGFFTALIDVAKRANADEPSALENDFDANWPGESHFIIPAGDREPNPRPDEYMKPKPERAHVFDTFVFVFLSQEQYNLLLPVVTGGGGKALVYDVASTDGKVDDVVAFVQKHRPIKGGIVVVQRNDDDEENVRMEQTLGHKGLQQNQFLDIILTLDTTQLRNCPAKQTEAAKPTPRKLPGRVKRNFGDFDPMQFQQPAREQSSTPEPEPEPEPPVSATNPLKRLLPTTNYDVLLPGQTNLKKRKLQTQPSPPPQIQKTPAVKPSTPKPFNPKPPPKPSIEDPPSPHPLTNEELSSLRDLIQIEEFSLPVRQHRVREADPRWEGRKDFKGFQRRGQKRRGGRRVIVTLEEDSNDKDGEEEEEDEDEDEDEDDSFLRGTGTGSGSMGGPGGSAAQQSFGQRSAAQQISAQRSAAQRSSAQQSTAHLGTAQQSTDPRTPAQRHSALQSTALRGTDSTTRRSTAHRSTVDNLDDLSEVSFTRPVREDVNSARKRPHFAVSLNEEEEEEEDDGLAFKRRRRR
ncbi:hypothetical protein K470DRAFT_255109 [Piedraia hortae CBS 480.64]|uniref:FHA domain-containing protein n=1 Tax=Piedraia hortae CBS 480.64 TaxID=1314780 RepID=A0A6A7C8U3_9PEZI|nr:hypothetical protein K470DRAFT_255109 [Piedraia hortae CBS 480.64]